MAEQSADDVRILARRPDGSEVDVTAEVRLVYELLNNSLDYGSGFLSIEDVAEITRLALAAGFASIPEADQQLAAYIHTVNSRCPTCGEWVMEYLAVAATVGGRILRAKSCGHHVELLTPPGEQASLRPAPEHNDGGES